KKLFGKGMLIGAPGFLLCCIVFGPILLLFLVVYLPFGLTINRLGYGLNNAIDRYRLCDRGVPWAPISLGFFTAVSGLLLLVGPLAAVFFVLLAIWAYRTGAVAASICRSDPTRFVEDKPPTEAPTGPPPSPLDVP